MAVRGASQPSLATAQRREQVVRLRQARMTFAAIGAQLGITGQHAGVLYREALAQVPRLAVEEHRVEELELVDLAIQRLMVIAVEKATPPKVRVDAWTAIRGWSERKAKLLGLDAPTRHEVITLDFIDAEIAKLESALAGRDQAEQAAAPAGADG